MGARVSLLLSLAPITHRRLPLAPLSRTYAPRAFPQVAMINWFEASRCSANAMTEHVTVVSAPLDICHTVPRFPGGARNPYGGYKVR